MGKECIGKSIVTREREEKSCDEAREEREVKDAYV